MSWSISGFALLIFGSGLLTILIGLAASRERPDPMAWPIALLMFAVAGWAIPHAISLGYTDTNTIAFWHRVRYPGTVLAPVAYLVIALRYAGYDRLLTRRVYGLLAVVPLLTIIAVWTNSIHRLFWQSLDTAVIDGATVFIPEFGPLYWVNLGYLYLVTLIGLYLFGERIVRAGPVYRKQALVMFIAAITPLLTNVAMQLGIGPDPMVDLTTTSLAISGAMFALALFHFDLLEVRPVARDRLVEDLDDGVIVVGPDGRIRDFNPTAAEILEGVRIDRPADEIFPPDLSSDGGELVKETQSGTRRYRTRSTPLTDGHGNEIGQIIYMNDITDLIQREQRISVLNRILRHNIRNELNLVLGRLDSLARQAGAEGSDEVQSASASIDRILEFADNARHIERTLQESETMMAVSAVDVANAVIADAKATYPEAEIQLDAAPDIPMGASAMVVDERLFEMALSELVENAIVHNTAAIPRVEIGIRQQEGALKVSVADNGPGIPGEEQAILDTRGETPLAHGSGLGLWLVHWTATLSSANLSFQPNDPQGSIVTLTFTPANQ